MQQHRMNETYTEKPHHMLHGYSVDPYEEEDGYVPRADNRSPRYRDSIAMDTYPLTQGKFDLIYTPKRGSKRFFGTIIGLMTIVTCGEMWKIRANGYVIHRPYCLCLLKSV